ncbi:stage II sporulation protein R [Cohnella caldifontis]|uniref:stage II sporulation protein R n=1 Tax=Cohnella caldifontis TaxID=3027471 RepID=UPI0023EAA2DC|nr:stage II sporulation protein R [Cohnella sp. YIM B05605]
MRRLGHHFPFFLSYRFSFARLTKLFLAYLILIAGLSAVNGKTASAFEDEGDIIPADAIRIRILANSDSDFDQQVKRSVRDRVEREIVSWGPMPGSHDEARAFIASHLDDVQAVADAALAEWSVPYGAKVELNKVPFPDKTFEGHTYTAGEYEALRISLGGGTGANWWCVLFPPLCLTAATASEEPAAEKAAAEKASGKAGGAAAEKTSAQASKGAVAEKTGGKAGGQASRVIGVKEDGSRKPQPKFFLGELLGKLGKFLKSLFS